ncbi:MAG TPA: LCP family protein [Anaerolineales bacterium]|nr:LCP family protein [Anaerolineales bacterium]
MKKHLRRAALFIGIVGIIAAGCSLSARTSPGNNIEFNTPAPFAFNTPDPNRPTKTSPPTLTPTPYPTPTPRDWPSPYFGTPGPMQITPVPPAAPLLYNPNDFTMLLLGSDRREVTFATDVILVVNFQPKYNAVSMLSIPRALLVYIPGWEMNKVNLAFQHGEYGYYPGLGAAQIKDTIEYNFGIEIDRYMLVDFDGFRDVIDTLNGVDVPVTCPYTDWHLRSPDLDPEVEENWALYTVPSGVVHMDGDLALWYARSRQKSSDADRNRRQQELIRALYAQALRLETVQYIPSLYSQLSDSVVTDFTLADALKMAPQLAELNSANIRSYYIDYRTVTRWFDNAGRALLVPNREPLLAMVDEMMGPPPEEDIVEDVLVEVWNGTTIENLNVLAAERLNYAGYESTLGDSDRTNYTQTVLYDFTENSSPDQAADLRELFNLTEDQFAAVPTPGSPFDFLLILGTDFDPCFAPHLI